MDALAHQLADLDDQLPTHERLVAGDVVEFTADPSDPAAGRLAATVIREQGEYVITWHYGWVHRSRLVALRPRTA